jgi:hypothetical protein
MEVIESNNSFPKKFYEFFTLDEQDAFYDEKILDALYGTGWKSILIHDSDNAFFHVFKPEAIPGTEYFDIEPLFGYFGPILNKYNEEFINESFERYRDLLKSFNVIAELVRFNPNLSNHKYFLDFADFEVVKAKNLVFVPCKSSDEELFKNYSTLRKRNVKYALKNGYEFRELRNLEEWMEFKKLYEQSMERVNSDKRWFFNKDFYDRNIKCDNIRLFGVYEDNTLCSAATMLFHPKVSHYFLAANDDNMTKGANDFLIHNMIKYCAENQSGLLGLGGGASSKDDDTLLEYKKKFYKIELRSNSIFYIGKLVLNSEMLNRLNTLATNKNPGLLYSKLLIKYRN